MGTNARFRIGGLLILAAAGCSGSSGMPAIPANAEWIDCGGSEAATFEAATYSPGRCVIGEPGAAGCAWVCRRDPEVCDFLVDNFAVIGPATCPGVCDGFPESLPGAQVMAWDPESSRCYVIGTTFEFRGQSGFQVVSAVPARKDDTGDLVPMCDPDGVPDGLILTMNLLGTKLKLHSSSLVDKDVSMRPGDIVRSHGGGARFVLDQARDGVSDPTIFPAMFEVELGCAEAYPDGDPSTCTDAQMGVRAAPTFVRYEGSYTPVDGRYPRPIAETGRMGVAVLVDQSGSMKGYVDRLTDAEVKLDSKAVDPTVLKDHASDPYNARLSAVREFFQNLNANEEAIVFKFNELEGGAVTVCANPDQLEEDEVRAMCFGKFRDLIFKEYAGEPSAFDKLQAGTEVKGRTPLWSAVLDVYGFMKTVKTEVRHVVVIGDGPDTCAPDSPDLRDAVLVPSTSATKPAAVSAQAICSDTGYKAVRDAVLADREARKADPSVPQVRVSFVQFQAPGYRLPDPRQQELACLTGGRHVFVNAQDLPRDDAMSLEQALNEALLKVRHTLAGSWRVGVEVPALAAPTLPKGAILALEGSLKMLKDGNKLTDKDTSVPLDVRSPNDVGAVANLDQRLAVRLPCAADGDCAWLGHRLASAPWHDPAVHSCATYVCDPEVKACRAATAADGATCADALACTLDDTCVLGYCGGELASGSTEPPAPEDPCAGKTEGDPCDDGNACTNSTTCRGGACTNGVPAPMDTPCETDGNPCTYDLCDDTGTCGHRPSDGGSCGADLPCIVGAICQAGVCAGGTHAPNLSACGAAGLCWDGECVQLPDAMKSTPAECVAQ